MQTLDTIEVYLLAKEFRKQVVKTANTFPKDEKFLLTAPVKDSARSITVISLRVMAGTTTRKPFSFAG